MTRYRTRPTVVEAVQFKGFDVFGLLVLDVDHRPDWLADAIHDGKVQFFNPCLRIQTGEEEGATSRADPGDWIIRRPRGGLWRCREDVFAAKYEVEEALPALCEVAGG